MIRDYLNQQITLQRATGSYNRDGEAISESISIPARVEGKRRLVRNESGAQVVSETRAFLAEEVRAGDSLGLEDGSQREVISVSSAVSLSGQTEFYEAAL